MIFIATPGFVFLTKLKVYNIFFECSFYHYVTPKFYTDVRKIVSNQNSDFHFLRPN